MSFVDPKPVVSRVLTRWGAAQVERLKQAFSVGGHILHGGPQWVPNKDGDFPPLNDSGRLRNSTYFTVGGTTVTIGNSDPIASFHQEGTSRLPQRVVVIVTAVDMAELLNNLKIELEHALRRV